MDHRGRLGDLSTDEIGVLGALIDAIVPADGYPSGTEAGVLDYLASQFARELRNDLPRYRLGLDALDAEAALTHEMRFGEMEEADRHRLLCAVEEGRVGASWPIDPREFLADAVEHVMEGYYGDPRNGGNRDAVSWQMVGFVVTD